MKFHFRTFGCKVNWLDTARITTALQLAGHEAVADERAAELVLVNSCTVTAEADRKGHQAVAALEREGVRVAVLGCSPRVDPAPWRHAGRAVYADEAELLQALGVEPAELPFPLESRTRLPLAIQGGCDDECSFCITRIARGRHFSLPERAILEQLDVAVDLGVKEVIITGINLAAWGCRDTRQPESGRLGALLQTLLARSEMPRIRLSSLGPHYLDQAFFDAFSDPRICAHLHLSVQSGDEGVLRAMRRGHGRRVVVEVAEEARRRRPEVALAADLISGFPTEDAAAFEQSKTLVSEVRFAKLHVFPYSARSGTPAAELAQLDMGVRRERARELRELGDQLRRSFIQQQLGTTHEVLIERGGKGLTGNYIRVHALQGAAGELRAMTLTQSLIAEPGWS